MHNIVTEEMQPKQHVSLQMALRRSLVWVKYKEISWIQATNANSYHIKDLICLDYIRATR